MPTTIKLEWTQDQWDATKEAECPIRGDADGCTHIEMKKLVYPTLRSLSQWSSFMNMLSILLYVGDGDGERGFGRRKRETARRWQMRR